MTQPVEVDIPHKLGRAGVRTRIDGGIDKLAGMIPGGTMHDKRWDGDTLHFTISAMGQSVAAVRRAPRRPASMSVATARPRTDHRTAPGVR